MNNDWRDTPVTDDQKHKLRFFGCTWDDGITAGQASDALDECARQFPSVETAYQNRPATSEQLIELQSLGFDVVRPITCSEAAGLIQSGKIKNAAQQNAQEPGCDATLTEKEPLPPTNQPAVRREGFFCGAPSDSPAPSEHLPEQTMSKPAEMTKASLPGGATASFLIRWKGKEEGLFPADVIRGKFATNEISLQHEVFHNGQWTKLLDFFIGMKMLVEGRKPPAEVIIQEAAKPNSSNPGEYTIPAREVPGFAKPQTSDTFRVLWPKLDRHINDIKNPNKYVRKIAAVGLGRSKDPLAVKPLISCLGDSDWGVRMQAAQSLGELGFSEAVEALIEALKAPEDYMRKVAADALGQLKDTRAVDALVAVALEDPKVFIRQTAAAALARIKGKTPTYATAEQCSHDRYAALQPVKDEVSAFAGQKVEPLLKTCATTDNCYWLPVANAAILAQVFAETKLVTWQSRQIANKIQWAGYCVEPDARLGGVTYDWHQTIGVFKACDNDSTLPSPAYLGAANLLRLCVVIAAADGQIDEVELDVFRQVIENQLDLTQTDHRRLQVLAKLLMQDPSSVTKRLAKVAKSIPAHKRLLVGRVLVRVAAADGMIAKDERRTLERIFKVFEISQEILENLILLACPLPQAGNSQRPPPVSIPAEPNAPKVSEAELAQKKQWDEWMALQERISARHKQFSIPKAETRASSEQIAKPAATPAASGFTLDMNRVYDITSETKEVAGILSVLMADEPKVSVALGGISTVPAAELPQLSDAGNAGKQPTRFRGLDAAFQPIIERLLVRDSWSLADFNALAREFQFMPLNIRDTLNEWSDESLGDFILDGEDPLFVRRELMAKENI